MQCGQKNIGAIDRRPLVRVRREDEFEGDATVGPSCYRPIYARDGNMTSSNPLVRAVVDETKFCIARRGPISARIVAHERLVQGVSKRGGPGQRVPIVTQPQQSDRVPMNPAEHAARRRLETMLPIAETDEFPGRAHVHLLLTMLRFSYL